MIDLSFIPHANNYDGGEGYQLWAFGDSEKAEDTWHCTVWEEGYIALEPVPPTNALTGSSPFNPPVQEGIPVWEIYSDHIYSQQTEKLPEFPHLSELQSIAPKWDGNHRNPRSLSANRN